MSDIEVSMNSPSNEDDRSVRAQELAPAGLANPVSCGVDSIPDTELLRRAVFTARQRRGRAAAKHPRWAGVMDTFMLGSTYAWQLCRRNGLDPDELVKR
jgi:hypothetical protein